MLFFNQLSLLHHVDATFILFNFKPELDQELSQKIFYINFIFKFILKYFFSVFRPPS